MFQLFSFHLNLLRQQVHTSADQRQLVLNISRAVLGNGNCTKSRQYLFKLPVIKTTCFAHEGQSFLLYHLYALLDNIQVIFF